MDVPHGPGPRDGHADGPSESFVAVPEQSADVRRLYDADTAERGYVMNLTRVWAHLPAQHDALFELLGAASSAAGLSVRDRGVLVAAMAPTLGDSYCSLAWGSKLASVADPAVAADVLTGSDATLSPVERALARWARRVTADPNGTGRDDVDELREAGYDDRQIVAITIYLALRIAFSTVNDALGAAPDKQLVEQAPEEVRRAVTWGRPSPE
jgi:uncharacterized peroxidase-related enzyme